MNDNIQNKRQTITELESLLSRKRVQTQDIHQYCEYMKQVFLACSTDN